MPRYVTESGYEEPRTSAPASAARPAPHGLKLVNLLTHDVKDLSFDALPGIAVDPLAKLRAEHKLDPLKGNRPVRSASTARPITSGARTAPTPP
jgi:hypothetical protein